MTCDDCNCYHWYYDYCDKWKCKVDSRCVHNCIEPRRTPILDAMVHGVAVKEGKHDDQIGILDAEIRRMGNAEESQKEATEAEEKLTIWYNVFGDSLCISECLLCGRPSGRHPGGEKSNIAINWQ